MAKAYWVVTYRSMTNEKAWSEYAKLAVPALTGAGGRFMVAGMPAKAWESGMNQRVVVVEFPSMEQAHRWYTSPEYAEALALRQSALNRRLVLVDGVKGADHG